MITRSVSVLVSDAVPHPSQPFDTYRIVSPLSCASIPVRPTVIDGWKRPCRRCDPDVSLDKEVWPCPVSWCNRQGYEHRQQGRGRPNFSRPLPAVFVRSSEVCYHSEGRSRPAGRARAARAAYEHLPSFHALHVPDGMQNATKSFSKSAWETFKSVAELESLRGFCRPGRDLLPMISILLSSRSFLAARQQSWLFPSVSLWVDHDGPSASQVDHLQPSTAKDTLRGPLLVTVPQSNPSPCHRLPELRPHGLG
ncbi:hypothetical protein C8Q77DRAFT_22927 [Trametes polyzona]|nr:hypothetical protein C8Q77DRAFT_22927 [Trametes polyzona]